ncbi:MAG TPA: hypothetical protein VH116_03330 [Gemmatimonadales bacterium]|jgi:hypothetical protein|nr:hypothetical protein [Gemmatimonadales bacterium]
MKLLLGFLIVTLGWGLIARTFGPPLGQVLYREKLRRRQANGVTVPTQEAEQAWAQQAGTRSLNIALILLALACGAAAGLLNFPLIGFSRSLNGWSWLRILTLMATSWIVTLLVYGLNDL